MRNSPRSTSNPEFVAIHGRPALGGKVDDAAWTACESYPLAAMMGTDGDRTSLAEPGAVRFLWDQDAFYLRADFIDSDVVTEAKSDGLYAFEFGDLCELFLQPSDAPCYGEFYVTPNQHQTTFLWAGIGRRLPSALQVVNTLTVVTSVQGTINDVNIRDHGWSAEMAVPWNLLESGGRKFGPSDSWRVLVGRYNYGVALPSVELSSAPPLSATDFHLTSEYAMLCLQPPG